MVDGLGIGFISFTSCPWPIWLGCTKTHLFFIITRSESFALAASQSTHFLYGPIPNQYNNRFNIKLHLHPRFKDIYVLSESPIHQNMKFWHEESNCIPALGIFYNVMTSQVSESVCDLSTFRLKEAGRWMTGKILDTTEWLQLLYLSKILPRPLHDCQ